MGLSGSLEGSSLPGGLAGEGIRQFDTGLFKPQRTMAREGIAAMLQPLLVPAKGGAANGYVRAISSLPRPLKNHNEEELGWIGNATQGQAPCILIALGDKDYSATGIDGPSSEYMGSLEVAIYVVSGNVRSFIEGRLATDAAGSSSPNADPGVEAMLEHVEELLIGQDPDIRGLHELRPQSENEVFTGGEETVWEQRYLMKLERCIDPARLVGLLTSIEDRVLPEGTDPSSPIVDTINTLGVP